MDISKGKTALFFGSFDPIHIGHLIIAEYVLNLDEIDEVWFVISPQSPFKMSIDKASEQDRLEMLSASIKDVSGFRICDIEGSMPAPHYTVRTLMALQSANPHQSFILLIGADNLRDFSKWKDYKKILEMLPVYVYPRNEVDLSVVELYENVFIIQAPLMDISSSAIRKNLTEGKSVRFMLHSDVYDYILGRGLYQ